TMIHDDKLVGNVEDKVTLIGRSILMQPQRLELQSEIVTESSIQPEVVVFRTSEEIHNNADDPEDRRLFAPLFFSEAARRLLMTPSSVCPRISDSKTAETPRTTSAMIPNKKQPRSFRADTWNF